MRTGRDDWRWGVAVLLLFGLLAASCASHGGPTPIDPPPPPVVTFAVTVTDAQTGAAIADARVDVQWTATEDDGRTNADGYWSVLAPAHVPFVVQVVAEGYDLAEQRVDALSRNFQALVALRPSVRPPWPGRLAIGPGQRCFINGNGECELPLGLHFGEAFSLDTRNPAAVDAELAEAKRAGYDLIRSWDTLGYWDSAWAGKELMPWRFFNHSGRWIEATPDYYAQLERTVGKVKAAGLALHLSRGDLNSSSLSQVLEHTERMAQIFDRLGWDTVALAEALNEQWQNGGWGPADLRRIVEPFKRRGAITALSAGFDGEEPEVVKAFAADVFYIHGARGPGYPLILRHIFSLAREQLPGVPRLGWQGEPAGPGSGVTGGQVNDREMLALMAAQSFIARQAWVYMSSNGVFYNGRISSQPGYWAVPRIRDAMEAFGRDLMAWHLTHRSSGDAALRSDAATELGDERIDQTIAPDGRIAAVVYGNTGRQGVQNATSRQLSCDIIGVADDEQLTRATETIQPGGWMSLSYRVGRLLLCSPVVSGDVFPGSALDNGSDVSSRDSEPTPKPRLVGDAAIVERSDLPHPVGRQLAATDALAFDVSPLAHGVVDVVRRGPQKQVFRVDARGNVARVADEPAGWDTRFCGDFPTGHMRVDLSVGSTTAAYCSVAVGLGVCPEPATVGNLNLFPEPLLKRPYRFARWNVSSTLFDSHVTSSGSVVRGAAVFEHRSRSAYFSPPFAVSGEALRSPVQ